MKCPNCGLDSPAEMRFCGQCGYELTASSHLSNKAHPLEEKLARIQHYLPEGLTRKILAQKDRIEGERRQVTVMFCDLEGSTAKTEKLGDEKAFVLIDEIFGILTQQVHRFEGTVQEFRGDGIMALFGAPIALENTAQRAISTSLAIHQEINRFNNRIFEGSRGPAIRMRIGIHTGPVILGSIGNDLRLEFQVIGDTVNLAARIEALAEPGTTYVTEETYQLAKGLFHFQPVGKKVVKGKEEPISVYKVLSAKEDLYRPRLGSERLIYSRLVGRDNELNRLELQVMKAINGQGSVVNIIGEAGIGKSRLLAELKNREVMKRVTLLEGRAVSIGKNLSFHPIIDLFKQWADIRNDDGETRAFDKLQVAIRRLFHEDYKEVLPFVAILMGMKLSGIHAQRVEGIEGEALNRLILKSVRDLVVKAAELSPLVVVIDDWHWADTSSVELLTSLFRLAETHRIVFINLFRPGYQETGDILAESLKDPPVNYYFEMILENLPEKISQTLIGNMLNLRDLPQAFITKIIERTGGNPFFIEEVVRSLIDEQVILPKGGRFQLTDKVSNISIPNTIEALLMARIDRLEEQTRDLIKEASVIGRSFFYRILEKVAYKIENIDVRLIYLQEIQLLLERLRIGELEYLFKHALAQEVAYESILPMKRKELHLRVAQAIEKVFDERLHEFFGMLAYHYCQAESLEEAEVCLIKAGEEALRSSASDEALHYYEEALQLYLKNAGPKVDPEKVAMLEKNIALALYNRGQHQEAIQHFDKALDYYWGKLPKNGILVVVKLLTAFLHLLLSLYLPSFKFRKTPTERDNEIADLFFKKSKFLSLVDAKRFFVECFYLFRFISSFDLRQFKEGTGIFATASALFSYSGISFALSRKVLDTIKGSVDKNDIINYTMYEICDTVYHFLGGNWKELRDYDEDLVDKNCRIGRIYELTQLLYWQALGDICQGSFDKARSIVDKLNDLYEVYGNDLSKTFKYELNTWLLIESGKLSEAMTESEKGIDFEEKVHSGFWDLHLCQAWIHILTGAIPKAQECLERADRICGQIQTAPFQLSAHYKTRMEFDLCRLKESMKIGNSEIVPELQRKALKSGGLLRKVARKTAYHRTDSYRLTGAYYWTINKQEKALGWWHKGVQEGVRLGARPQLARLYFEIGRCLLAGKDNYTKLDSLPGETYLEKAKALYVEMGMESSLEEIDRVFEMRTFK
ncbi:MAG: AAA family ATPase [Deltaproteobacteria bacterium]|nr:AAA family ATPase [Deltaproteobacteria bacterium]